MTTVKRKRTDGLETIERVIKFAQKEIDKHGSTEFNLDRVIEQSGVSRSSIYHHFGNRAGLIAAVDVRRAIDNQLEEMEVMRVFIAGASNVTEILQAIEYALAADGSSAGRMRRLRRVDRIVAATKNKALHKSLEQAQIEGSRHLAETLQMAKDRGLINPAVPVEGIAYWVQSLLLGRILIDIGATEHEEKAWIEAVSSSLGFLLRTT